MSFENINQLDDNDFDKKGNIKEYNKDVVTVMFYTNWCPHCTNAKPIFSKIATRGKLTGDFFTVDCEENKTILKKLSIDGFPTFCQFKDGELWRKYEGSYNNEGEFVNFMCGKKGC